MSDHAQDADNVRSFEGAQASLVRCDGCDAEFIDIEAATHQDGYSEKGCPKGCHRLTTPVYWPAETGPGWVRVDDERPNWSAATAECFE